MSLLEHLDMTAVFTPTARDDLEPVRRITNQFECDVRQVRTLGGDVSKRRNLAEQSATYRWVPRVGESSA